MSKILEGNDARNTAEISFEVNDIKKGAVCAATARTQTEINLDHGVLYNQCFSGSDFQSQYEEECPVNYSLKYSETEPCKVNKAGEHNEKFEEFTEEYAETDLDQPTDFSLKYGESSGEEVKSSDFNYYDREKSSSSKCINVDAVPTSISVVQSGEVYSCEHETPLMFSRCSSLNSLSSFEHITQSIPDDRSSLVSEFSRTTSGIISPSELPDSPTQTAPSSPKRNNPVCFPIRGDQTQKKSVFEDDVATYKQEDTPIEFSRSTSFSSLNIDNPTKAEFNLKTNSKASSITGGDDNKAKEVTSYSALETTKADAKDEVFNLKVKAEKHDVNDDASPEEDILINGINNIRIEPNRGDICIEKDGSNNGSSSNHVHSAVSRGNSRIGLNGNFGVKPNIPPIFSDPIYEASDDDVHTYHTEGTPANISHAGSHSDLSTLSMISGILPSGTVNNSDNESFCSGGDEVLLSECNQIELAEINEKQLGLVGDSTRFKSLNEESVETIFNKSCTPLEEALVEQCIRLGMPQKTNSKKLDESSRKSQDKGVDTWYTKSCTPLEEALVEQCIRLGMPRKNKKVERGSLGALAGEEKILETEKQNYFSQKKMANTKLPFSYIKLPSVETRNILHVPKRVAVTPPPFFSYPVDIGRTQSVQSLPTDIWFNETCTPLEEALVEQCIRLGMSQKKSLKNINTTTLKHSGTSQDSGLKAASAAFSFINKSKTRQGNSSLATQEKETSKKPERFVCNPARRQSARKKKTKETCRRCRKCKEKSRGIV